MRIEDKFEISEEYSGPIDPNALTGAPSLRRGCFYDLEQSLVRQGVTIDLVNSEKEIEYDTANFGKIERKVSTIPFLTTAGRGTYDLNVVGYILKAAGLELTIRDYQENSRPDLDGGSITARKGVRCSVCLETNFSQDAALIDRIKKTLTEFYTSPPETGEFCGG